jgi:predicted cobalt transporter CbtA
VIDPESGRPADNSARDIWVTATALSTALNTSYMADRLSVFGIVVGIALLLTGIGFGVLVATGAVRDRRSA